MNNRRSGGLYRWETRYLEPADAAPTRDVVVRQHRKLRSALCEHRADLSRADANLIASSMVSVVASPATHRATLPSRSARSLLADAATSLADVELPAARSPTPPTNRGLTPASKREALLVESISLFAARGFHETTVDDLARAAGLPPSGIYRHFSSKAAILEAAFWRASDRTTASITDALSAASTPRNAIESLVGRYVHLSAANPDLITVYMTEIGNVPADVRRALRNQQRLNVEEWAVWVARAKPGQTGTQARFLVHAALNVIFDQIRLGRELDESRLAALACTLLT